jgi:NAD(P)-dependent dehydrogenase (short-subunit alcohol dehydrogenase family)
VVDLTLRGKVALVTGASRGIGRAVALQLAREGCALHLTGRDEQALEQTRQAALEQTPQVALPLVRGAIAVHVMDLAAPGAAARLAEMCGDIDILINNAGATPTGPIEDATEARWREGLELKVLATVLLTRAVYARMCARKDGVIVNVIGNCGERPDPDIIIATVTNTGLMGFTRALGAISPPHGVRVLGVNPGPTLTERLELLMRRKARDRTGTEDGWRELMAPLPFGRPATPQEVADFIVFAASPRASYVSGTVLTIDGGVASRGHLF